MSGVYLRSGDDREFPYSDGDDVESRLLAVLRGATDRAVGSVELTRAIQDFASRYHLSSQRANVLRPVRNLLTGKILVVGAGCGAEARFIGETGAEVWAVEGSKRRAEICAERCRDLPNVSVYCTRLEDFEPAERFDVVTLVGVLEYSPTLFDDADAPAHLLRLCRDLLRPEGLLLLAIENLLGLKYFAGAPEDHIGVPFANMNGVSGAPRQPVTFGRANLTALLQNAGLTTVDFLYPFPDYKFPRAIVHPAAAEELGESLGEIIRAAAAADSSLPYERSFSEEMCWPAITRNMMVEDMANSFLALARMRPGDVLGRNSLVYLYADVRRRAFAKETVIEKSAEGLVVRRRKLYPESEPVGPYIQEIRDERWISGPLLISQFFEVVNRPGWGIKDIAEWGRGWMEFLRARAVRGASEDPDDLVVPAGLVDCIPSNLIVNREGGLTPFDQEWIASDPPPMSFVLFRGLWGLFAQVRSIEAPAAGVPASVAQVCRQVLLEWGIPVSDDLLAQMARRECALQEAISGISPDPDVFLRAPLPGVRRDFRPLAALTHFDNGVPIVPVLRECYAAAEPRVRLSWSGSAVSTGFGSFYYWLNSPAGIPAADACADLEITELAAYIYAQRPDVRAAFPDLASNDRMAFADWLLRHGGVEYQLDEAFVRATAAALRRCSESRARDAACEETQRRLDELTRRAEAAGKEAVRLEERVGALENILAGTRGDALEARKEADKKIAALEAARRTVEVELNETHSALDRARDRVGEFATAAARYGEAFHYILDGYRGQRAWRVMVEIRRAYTMIVRGGWKGAIRWITGPRLPLDEFELSFPALSNYLPAVSEADSEVAQIRDRRDSDAPAPHRYDVVILAIIDFDFRFQRPQQIAAQMARQGHRVFWVSATRVLPPDSPDAFRAVPLRDGIWEIRVRAPQCDPYVGVLSDETARAFTDALEAFYREWGVAGNVIMVQLPFWRKVAVELRREPFSCTLYDCMDDWDTFENLGDFNRSEERALAAECDILTVTAAKLVEKFESRGLAPVLVRNGSDFHFFAAADPLPELTGVSRPVIGYFGAIADWIDLDLVYEVAKARPRYSFVLAGQVFNRDVSALESLPNVRLLGSRPYEQMPRLLSGFDVCIIPFLLNQVTHATDPVKLYEYLAQGKPVVATDMNELQAWSELLYLARGPEEFASKLDAAVAESDSVARSKRIAFARTNSWQARVEVIDREVVTRFPKVSVLIVSYNSAEYLGPCLRALMSDTCYPNIEVIVVDNASADASVEVAGRFSAADHRIRVVKLTTNTGFAGGNNAAAKMATGDYIVLLNADAMVAPGWLSSLLRHMELDRSIGQVCPITNFAGNEAKINVDYSDEFGMRRFAWRIARRNRGTVQDIAVAPLFCTLMRRDVYMRLGGLDEGYRIGMFEDDDLSEAVRQRGLRVCVADDSFVHHFGQGSFSKLDPHEYNRIFEANRERYEKKWNKPWVRHTTRSNVRPAYEEKRFTPAEFCKRPSTIVSASA